MNNFWSIVLTDAVCAIVGYFIFKALGAPTWGAAIGAWLVICLYKLGYIQRKVNENL